jgi:hypothetical protein
LSLIPGNKASSSSSNHDEAGATGVKPSGADIKVNEAGSGHGKVNGAGSGHVKVNEAGAGDVTLAHPAKGKVVTSVESPSDDRSVFNLYV